MNQFKTAESVTVRVGPLVNLALVVQSLGVDPDPLFRESGFGSEEFQDPDHRTPYLQSSRLLAGCVEATGCEHLGLLIGQKANPSLLGLPGFLIRAAPNVEKALVALVDNLDLHDGGGSAMLDMGPEFTSLSFNLHLPGVAATEQICDLSAVIMYKIMQALCGPDWIASTVKFLRREPADWGPYRRYFKTALFFNSTECAITFGNDCLKQHPPSADSLLFEYLENEARHLHDLQHHELMEELPMALNRGLLTHRFAARDIADMFGLQERTLHRRLRSAGTSFRQELDRARLSVSHQLLGNTSLPICDIAISLGYADSSGFIRAFQRWNNTSPSSWRKHHGRQLNGE